MIKKADKHLMKLLNEKRILKLIRDYGPISIIEVSNKTQMSKVAIYKIIGHLIDEGIAIEVGKANSTSKGGKKPSLIKLNTKNRFVIGILFKRREARIALANIESKILDDDSLTFKVGSDINAVLPNLFNKIDNLLDRNKIEPSKLISISIGIPGLIDYEKGQLRFAHTLGGWGNRPIAAPFSERYKVPVSLENDVKLISLAESLLGAGKKYSEIVCIWIGEGISSGIIHNGKLLRGVQSSAGEIGYMELGHFCTDLEYLYFGQKYFGDILSIEHLLNTITNIIRRDNNLNTLVSGELTLNKVFDLASKKNEIICKVLDEYSCILSNVCDNFIKTLNPSVIILCGNIIDQGDYILKRVKKILHEKMQEIPISGTDILPGKLQDKVGLIGTIVMALETLFEPKPFIGKSNSTGL